MPRGEGRCRRKYCRGQMHVQAWTPDGGGQHVWLVCDMDARHVDERHDGPPAEDLQDSLPGLDTHHG